MRDFPARLRSRFFDTKKIFSQICENFYPAEAFRGHKERLKEGKEESEAKCQCAISRK